MISHIIKTIVRFINIEREKNNKKKIVDRILEKEIKLAFVVQCNTKINHLKEPQVQAKGVVNGYKTIKNGRKRHRNPSFQKFIEIWRKNGDRFLAKKTARKTG